MYEDFNRDRTKKDGYNPRCKECSRKWHHSNRDHSLAYQHDHYRSKRQYFSDKAKRYRAENRESMNDRKRKWDVENADRRREYRIRYKDLYAVFARNRRARILANGGEHSLDDIFRIYADQGGKCKYCSAPVEDSYHVDHRMPIALGGSNAPHNLQILCAPCNQSKNATHPDEWERLIGYV